MLSRATFVEWPNTTSNFSLHRGVAPHGKLVAHHKSRFLDLRPGGTETVGGRVCGTPGCVFFSLR